jgi:6-phosphogluconate dehydrogenase (decarboxylating)
MNQPGSDQAFVEVVQERVRASIAGIRRSAAAGDPAYQAMITNGVERSLMVAIEEMPGVLRIAE